MRMQVGYGLSERLAQGEQHAFHGAQYLEADAGWSRARRRRVITAETLHRTRRRYRAARLLQSARHGVELVRDVCRDRAHASH